MLQCTVWLAIAVVFFVFCQHSIDEAPCAWNNQASKTWELNRQDIECHCETWSCGQMITARKNNWWLRPSISVYLSISLVDDGGWSPYSRCNWLHQKPSKPWFGGLVSVVCYHKRQSSIEMIWLNHTAYTIAKLLYIQTTTPLFWANIAT